LIEPVSWKNLFCLFEGEYGTVLRLGDRVTVLGIETTVGWLFTGIVNPKIVFLGSIKVL
jgi:hypothetical protein